MEFDPYLTMKVEVNFTFLRNLSSSSANICIQALLLKILIKTGDRPWSCGVVWLRGPLRDDKNWGRLITVYREQVSNKLARKRIQLLISTLFKRLIQTKLLKWGQEPSMKRSVWLITWCTEENYDLNYRTTWKDIKLFINS